MMSEPDSPENNRLPEQLNAVAEKLSKGETVAPITIRELLRWFGAQRRGIYIVEGISQALSSLKLITEPDFREPWIDGEIQFKAAHTRADTESHPGTEEHSNGTDGEPRTPTPDPTFRIGRLPTASRGVTSVAPDAEIAQAITVMLQNDYSQLPVMIGERTVKGVVSWKSITRCVALGADYKLVRQCMDRWYEFREDRHLFDAMPTIIDVGYVLVRDGEQRITGIVTASDLSRQFHQMTEPFLLLSEIERHVRKLLGGKVTEDELREARDPSDIGRDIKRLDNLTLGECARLVENPQVWNKLGLPLIHRQTVTDSLKRITRVRNDVMHFNPDPLEEDVALLIKVSRFLQQMDEVKMP
jgi:CBS domain-containing protein